MTTMTTTIEAELAEGLRALVQNAERQRQAAQHLLKNDLCEQATLLLAARLEEVAKALFILEFMQQDNEDPDIELLWTAINQTHFPWQEAIPPQPPGLARKLELMAKNHAKLPAMLLHVGRGTNQWIRPERFGDEGAAQSYLVLGDTMTRRVFALTSNTPGLDTHSAAGEIPKPTWLQEA